MRKTFAGVILQLLLNNASDKEAFVRRQWWSRTMTWRRTVRVTSCDVCSHALLHRSVIRASRMIVYWNLRKLAISMVGGRALGIHTPTFERVDPVCSRQCQPTNGQNELSDLWDVATSRLMLNKKDEHIRRPTCVFISKDIQNYEVKRTRISTTEGMQPAA